MNRSRRDFLFSLGSAAAASPFLVAENTPTAHSLCLSLSQAAPNTSLEPSDSLSELQVKSNSTLWDQERWGPRLTRIDEDDITHLIGYNAHLGGGVRLSEGDIEPRRVPYGFTSKKATLSWGMQALRGGEYEVAVLYHSGEEDNVGSRLEVGCGKTSLATIVRSPTDVPWKGGTPALPAFRRDWLNGRLVLKRGMNHITFALSDPSRKQVELARYDLAHPANGWPKKSFHVLSAELVRPGVFEGMKSRATELRTSTEWLVKGKYGLFISWVPEGYRLYGTEQTYKHYQTAVNQFDVEAFAAMVEQSGAAWITFTTTHGKYYYPGPLKAMDRVISGRTCKRDLVGELGDALGRRNVRLMLYFHPGPSASEDNEWATAAGISPVDDQRYNQIMIDIFAEIGQRYGPNTLGLVRRWSIRLLRTEHLVRAPDKSVEGWEQPTFHWILRVDFSEMVAFRRGLYRIRNLPFWPVAAAYAAGMVCRGRTLRGIASVFRHYDGRSVESVTAVERKVAGSDVPARRACPVLRTIS